MKLKVMIAAAAGALALAGCNYSDSSPPPAQVTGTVENIDFHFDINIMTQLWSAYLLVSQPYNGAMDVQLANGGTDNNCFHNFIHDGDTLTVVAASSGSFNQLSASDVTVNGIPLSKYSC